jgi:hypothetical protein
MIRLAATDDGGKGTVADCVALRCAAHRMVAASIPEHDDGECAICVAQAYGTRAGQAVADMINDKILLPVLSFVADLLRSHCELRFKLELAERRLELLAPGAVRQLEQALARAIETSRVEQKEN